MSDGDKNQCTDRQDKRIGFFLALKFKLRLKHLILPQTEIWLDCQKDKITSIITGMAAVHHGWKPEAFLFEQYVSPLWRV